MRLLLARGHGRNDAKGMQNEAAFVDWPRVVSSEPKNCVAGMSLTNAQIGFGVNLAIGLYHDKLHSRERPRKSHSFPGAESSFLN